MSRSPTRDKIAAHIREHGPSSVKDMADELGLPITTIDGSIAGTRRRHKAPPPVHFRVHAWVPQRGVSGGPCALWGIGDRRDAPRPRADHKAAVNRYQTKIRAVIRARERGTRKPNPYLDLLRSANA